MRKAICTTTINYPTKALLKFIKIAKKDDWHVVIVGDKKTPHDHYQKLARETERVIYLTPESQEKMNKKLSDLIGWNCIQRRNFAFMYAYKAGAQVIATVDDDNIPLDGWGKPLHVGQTMDVDSFHTDSIAFDPLSVTDKNYLWHRGYPIRELPNRLQVKYGGLQRVNILVQAELWDGAPDIDAICRISHPMDVKIGFHESFDNLRIGFYTSNKPMPFNSQNTFIAREAFPDYFLFPHIGRMDDIWAAYYLQEKYPHQTRVIFGRPSVKQVRNEHDIIKDLEAEIIGYRNNENVIKEGVMKYLPRRAIKAFSEYQRSF